MQVPHTGLKYGKRFIILTGLLLTLSLPLSADAAILKFGHSTVKPAKTHIGVQLTESIIKQHPDPDTITPKQWEYTNGVILVGITKIYEKTHDKKYFNYVKCFVDKYVKDNGKIQPIREGHNMDVIQPSNLLFTLYQKTNRRKYLLCMEKTAGKYPKFPKNKEGGFWHKKNYANQMWLDGIYMTEPFIVRYGAQIAPKCASPVTWKYCFDTAAFQIELIAKHNLNWRGLAYHAWDASKSADWAKESSSGVSPEIWSRAMGWYAMALVDVLEYMPKSHPEYKKLQRILKKVVFGLKTTQDHKTGLWFQVMNKGKLKDNWTDTSGSAMFVYTIKKAVDLELVSPGYLKVANRGWEGIKTQIVKGRDGRLVVKGSAPAMGVQKDYKGYVSKSPANDMPHGIAAVLMAASVMEY